MSDTETLVDDLILENERNIVMFAAMSLFELCLCHELWSWMTLCLLLTCSIRLVNHGLNNSSSRIDKPVVWTSTKMRREYKEIKKQDVSHVIQTEEVDRQEEEGNAMKGGKSLSAGNQIKSSSLGSDERSCPFHPVFSPDRNRLFVSVFLWLQASVRSDDQENGITDKTYTTDWTEGDRENVISVSVG